MLESLKNIQLPSLNEIQTELARRSMTSFVLHTQKDYLMGWCHELICQKLDQFLDDVIMKKSPRLIIAMPPRSGKTELASRKFPAYAFGRYPNLNIIGTSYAADLASRTNRDVQRNMDSLEYTEIFPSTQLSGKNIRSLAGSFLRNSDIFEIVDHKGSYRSAGVGGGITGMGGDILIVDDPFKDRAEADSHTIREKVWDWYTSTLYTRQSPGAGIIVIATRWHPEDLTGRLIERSKSDEGDHWDVVNLPAIATCDEEYRKRGEALHPERYSLEVLEKIKIAIGSRDWEALYQQNPTIPGGTIFKDKWIQFYDPADLPDKFDDISSSWDLSFKQGTDTDFVVGQVWGRYRAEYYLLDQFRGRVGFVETLEQFRQIAKDYPTALEKYVEEKANGSALIDSLKKEISGIIPINPERSKEARAYAVTPLFEAGNVFLPNPKWCPWAQDYIDELLKFPNVTNDDQVDATTQYLIEKTHHARTQMKINPAILRRDPFRNALGRNRRF